MVTTKIDNVKTAATILSGDSFVLRLPSGSGASGGCGVLDWEKLLKGKFLSLGTAPILCGLAELRLNELKSAHFFPA